MKLVGYSRRLPIYLMVDTSASMHGAPIESVNTGLMNFAAALRGDPQALECASVSLITFASEARQVVAMVEAGSFSVPTLTAAGGTALGAGLRKLAESLARETRGRTESHPGDWRPLVFLMTDGQPTDDWKAGWTAYARVAAQWKPSIIGIACGPRANLSVLNEITRTVMLMPDMTPDVISSLFDWISQSVRMVSRSVSSTTAKAQESMVADLPPIPAGFRIQV